MLTGAKLSCVNICVEVDAFNPPDITSNFERKCPDCAKHAIDVSDSHTECSEEDLKNLDEKEPAKSRKFDPVKVRYAEPLDARFVRTIALT
jgi:hypothetical protein